MGIWSKKSITALRAEAASSEGGLKRTLGALNLTMLGIGAIIGAGIFVLTGTAAANFAGPGVSLSFASMKAGALQQHSPKGVECPLHDARIRTKA